MKMLKFSSSHQGITAGNNYKIYNSEPFNDDVLVSFFDDNGTFRSALFKDDKIGTLDVSGRAEIVMVVDLPTAEQAANYSLSQGRAIHEAISDALLPGGKIYAATRDSGYSHFAKGGYVKDMIAGDNIDATVFGILGAPVMKVKINPELTSDMIEKIMSQSTYQPIAVDAQTEEMRVLMELRDILQVPEGESILKHAKMVRALADGLLSLSGQPKGVR